MMISTYQFYRVRGVHALAQLSCWQWLRGWQFGYGLLTNAQVLQKAVAIPSSLQKADLPAYVAANAEQWLQWEGDALMTRYFLYEDVAMKQKNIWLSAVKASLLSDITVNAVKQKKVVTVFYLEWQYYLWQTIAWVKQKHDSSKMHCFVYPMVSEATAVCFDALGIKQINMHEVASLSDDIAGYIAQDYVVLAPQHVQHLLHGIDNICFISCYAQRNIRPDNIAKVINK